MAECSQTDNNNSSSDVTAIESWKFAKETLHKFVNNREAEALEIFQEHADDMHMYAGYFTAKVIDALMTLEEDKLTSALVILKDAEKICKQQQQETGWLNNIKSKVYGAENDSGRCARYYESQIILADSYMLAAALIFMQQDLSGYFKGGWVLRKAWKQYQDVYAVVLKLYETVKEREDEADPSIAEAISRDESEADEESKRVTNGYIEDYYARATLNDTFLPKPSDSSYDNLAALAKRDASDSSSPRGGNNGFFMRKSQSVNSALSKQIDRTRRLSHRLTSFGSSISLTYFTSTFNLFGADKHTVNNVDDESVKRLMGAVSFGYGLLQLGMSLLPPALVKFTNLLGFHGNTQDGLNNLMYARLSCDMRAPLARLALLWYHTIVRPFYAFDGQNVQSGVEMASQLIDETDELYADSALFLFFKGRVYRLKSDIDGALRAFQTAVDNSNQREVKLLSLHEIGWCQMMLLMFREANATFVRLKTISRWSRAFYTYVSAICAGACDRADVDTLLAEFAETIKCIPKGTQLDVLLCRRQEIFARHDALSDVRNSLFYKMLVYELLYLWNALPSCNDVERIVDDCRLAREGGNSPMTGLAELIEASCHCLRGEHERAVELLKSLIDERKNLPYNANDAHVSAFANYELGLLLVKEPELKSEGVATLQKVLNYKGYDFEQRLEVRVIAVIKRHRHDSASRSERID